MKTKDEILVYKNNRVGLRFKGEKLTNILNWLLGIGEKDYYEYSQFIDSPHPALKDWFNNVLAIDREEIEHLLEGVTVL